jgi:hypothetical protein
MDLKSFAKQRKHLFWYIKDTDNLSQESIIEHVLNYGNWKDFKSLSVLWELIMLLEYLEYK